MSTKYFRAIAYNPAVGLSVIIDSTGMFDTIDGFTSDLVSKGFKVADVTDDGQFMDVNISKAEPARDKVFIRASMKGWPDEITYELKGTIYRAYQVADKIYIPDRSKIISLKKSKPAEDLLKSYCQVKAENPSAIVFYRIGDFYEVFSPDAETVSIMLGLTLASRACGDDRIPMCGVPHHNVDIYVKKLIDCGFKVVIAEPVTK